MLPNHTIWSYWEGPKPPYIEVCLRSINEICKQSNGRYTFNLVTPTNLDEYLPIGALNPVYKEIKQIGPKASAIRAALLAVYGGWWWDADTVALKTPDHLESLYSNDILYTTWPIYPSRALNGYIFASKGSKAALDWLAAVNNLLATDFDRATRWLELGERSLTPIVLTSSYCVRIDRRITLPISIDDHVQAFFQARDYREFLLDTSICFGLNHSWFMCYHESDMMLKPCHWRGSPLLIHQLLADTLDFVEGKGVSL